MKKQLSFLVLMLMLGTAININAQSITYNYDASKKEQITVMELGAGSLTPEYYYRITHNNYWKNAKDRRSVKNDLRVAANTASLPQVEYADSIEADLESRAKVEAANIIDREIDMAWITEGSKLEKRLMIFKNNINALNGKTNNEEITTWQDLGKTYDFAIKTIRKAYMPNSERQKQYLAIMDEIIQSNDNLLLRVKFLMTKNQADKLVNTLARFQHRVDENAKRLQSTCRGILMPEVSTELFTEMVKKVVRLNQEYIPTYESGATLYIRPLLIGTSAQVGVHPSKEYCFLIFVTPVGPYFKGGFAANPYVIIRDYDRSAPLGTGKYKVGGNYAASLFANNLAHEKGYACEFYLDAKEKKYMDECGAANFFGIKDNTYITPKSTSILPSITNKSLMQVAEDLGMKVERRPIPEEELETFEEAGACGTAAVISPISYIDDLDTGKRYSFGDKPGPMSKKLFDTLRGIQYGEIEDKHGWTTVVIE